MSKKTREKNMTYEDRIGIKKLTEFKFCKEGEEPKNSFLESDKWEGILDEYQINYKEFNEEYCAFYGHIAHTTCNVFLIKDKVEVMKDIPSTKSKKGFVRKKVKLNGYRVFIRTDTTNLREEFNKGEFSGIIQNEFSFENLEDAKNKFNDFKLYVDEWKKQADLSFEYLENSKEENI